MLLPLLVCSLLLVSVVGQQANDDWVDPHDMLHYDSASKTMRKPNEPTDSSEALYDAKVGVSKEAITEIQKLLDSDGSFTAGADDTAVSQLQRDYEDWKWRSEHTLSNIELLLLVAAFLGCILLWAIVILIVCWLMQPSRLFAVSIVWNWFSLYEIAFAEHQNNLAKMDSLHEKCTGMKKMDWSDSLKEWYRSTWTLQADPCKSYYENLNVDPILLVPPTKAISITITTFITEAMKQIGQGISEFLRALLKDLPVPLQTTVLHIIVLIIVVFVCASVQAAFLHGILAPLGRRGPPPPGLQQPQQQPQVQIQGVADLDPLARRDAHQQGPRQQAGRAQRNAVRQRRSNRSG